MIDLKLQQDSGLGTFDVVIAPNGDLEAVNDFSTAILLSLLTDQRADDNQVAVPEFRRGWIGDIEPPSANYKIGSQLWLIEPAKATQQTVNLAVEAARDALQWMLDQGIARNIEVSGTLTGPRQATLLVEITAPDGSVTTQYLELWENTAFQPASLPAPIIDIPPFTLQSIADLVVLVDARDSDHSVDDTCGIITAEDVESAITYSQSNAARRPLRLNGSGGWFYRFDGTDDFLATNQQPFPSLVEGTAFLVYKPTDTAVDGGRFLALGGLGDEASVTGLAFLQNTGDLVRLLGSGGSLDVSVVGPASGDAPTGVLVRWGPGTAGGEIETATGTAANDPSYNVPVQPIDQIVLGAGFDGAGPDPTQAAGFEANVFALYSRRISDLEALDVLDYAGTRIFTSPVGEPADDCFYPVDDFGFADG